ncbi:MAG TPA: hypothetical protein VIX90_02685 [Edaphobacter sp.]
MSRFAVSLLLVCATALSQTPSSLSLKSFHDATSGVAYFYPGEFMSVAPAAPAKTDAAAPHCVRTSFSAGSSPAIGDSAFVFSVIDNACPGVLKEAQQLGSFTRAQILRQMKRYGTPIITHDPVRYTIAGHPAAVTLASAQATETQAAEAKTKGDRTTYAAKACVLTGSSTTGHGSDPKQVLCFDFTTTREDILPRLSAFSVQFDGEPLQSLVPGTILR